MMKQRSRFGLHLWDGLGTVLLNIFVLLVVIVYLFPISFMLITALKPDQQFLDRNAPVWPAQRVTTTYEGEEYSLFKVPTDQGIRELALIQPGRNESQFYDPEQPEAGLITWEGAWRTLEPLYEPYFQWSNFAAFFDRLNIPQLSRNTLIVVGLSEIGVLLASILVAYGFARFPIPKGDFFFMLLVATIIIPDKVTLIPTYFTFARVFEWIGTQLPLIVPFWFGNAVLIFLLRQNFKSIPREMEEAAMIDGAGPLRILWSIILPQAVPTLVTVALLHFFFAWNEVRLSALYLSTAPSKYTFSYTVAQYQGFFPTANLLQVSALVSMVVPITVLLLAQRYFMRGVQVTGLEK